MGIECMEQHEERVKRLTTALDFFSQVLSVEQLTLYGFSFLHDMLSLENSALFMKSENGHYELCNHIGMVQDMTSYKDDGRLSSIATRLGRALWNEFDMYFERVFIETWQIGLIVPIIIQDQLLGFIISKGVKSKDQELIDVAFVENIKNIMNMAFYMAVTFEKGKELESEINKRIFNLFFVNQSTKVLLSELNIDHLYQLCIDVVRELTSSAKTSFCLFDEIRESVIVKGYNDIVTFKKAYVEFNLKTRIPQSAQMVYSVEKDHDALSALIENVDGLNALGAKYVILLVKDEILGFVTVGEPVNQVPYDEGVLSQIESLASSIYISITNAMFIRHIQTQNDIIDKQLRAIKNLNRTVKNINSCQSLEEICEIALTTLDVSHSIRSAFVASRMSDGKFEVLRGMGCGTSVGQVFTADELHEKCRGSFYFDYDHKQVRDKIPQRLLMDCEMRGCAVVSPLKLDVLELDGTGIVGYIVILAADKQLGEEDLYVVETLSNLMAPIFRHMQICTALERQLKPDQRAQFYELVQMRLIEKEEYQLDFRVYYKKLEQRPFESPDFEPYRAYRSFSFDGYLYVVAQQDDWVDTDLFDACVDSPTAESMICSFEGNATA